MIVAAETRRTFKKSVECVIKPALHNFTRVHTCISTFHRTCLLVSVSDFLFRKVSECFCHLCSRRADGGGGQNWMELWDPAAVTAGSLAPTPIKTQQNMLKHLPGSGLLERSQAGRAGMKKFVYTCRSFGKLAVALLWSNSAMICPNTALFFTFSQARKNASLFL